MFTISIHPAAAGIRSGGRSIVEKKALLPQKSLFPFPLKKTKPSPSAPPGQTCTRRSLHRFSAHLAPTGPLLLGFSVPAHFPIAGYITDWQRVFALPVERFAPSAAALEPVSVSVPGKSGDLSRPICPPEPNSRWRYAGARNCRFGQNAPPLFGLPPDSWAFGGGYIPS